MTIIQEINMLKSTKFHIQSTVSTGHGHKMDEYLMEIRKHQWNKEGTFWIRLVQLDYAFILLIGPEQSHWDSTLFSECESGLSIESDFNIIFSFNSKPFIWIYYLMFDFCQYFLYSRKCQLIKSLENSRK
jgi:hypothetical protein